MTKISKKSFAAVVVAMVLAIVCAISAVTYAYFTDTKNGDGGTLNFGSIVIDGAAIDDTYLSARTSGADDTTDLMPGDTLTAAFSVKKAAEADEDMWVAFKLEATGDAASVLGNAATVTGWTLTDGIYYKDAAIADATAVTVEVVYTISPTTGNTMQTKTVTFTLKVAAIQEANVDAATAKTQLAGLLAA